MLHTSSAFADKVCNISRQTLMSRRSSQQDVPSFRELSFPELIERDGRLAELRPNNYHLLNDLRWALTESGQLAEVEALLVKAAGLAPPGDDLARNNLEEARRRKRPAHPH